MNKFLYHILLAVWSCSVLSFGQHDHDEHDHDEHPSSADIWRAIGITTFAGLAAFIGGFSIFCIKKEQIGVMPASLSFSSGVIIYLSFVGLIPESIEQFAHTPNTNEAMAAFYALLCVIGGVLTTISMEVLLKRYGLNAHNHSNHVTEEMVSVEKT